MKQIPLPTFTDLSQALTITALKPHPSQVHGLIAGVLTGNPASDVAWEKLITGDDPQAGAAHETLQSLYDNTAAQLEEFLFDFQLVMPDDQEALPVRAEALTLWCQGFLTGLKLSGVPIAGREPDEVGEAINDLIEIAKMNYEEVVPSEEDEAAYVELVEYVRMAAVLIYQAVREDNKSGQATQSTGHLH